MSEPTRPPDTDDQWEAAVQRMAVDMVYPPTPDIANKVRQRLDRPASYPISMLRVVAQVVLILGLVLAALLTVPQVRAEVFRILQIGVIRVIFDEPIAPTVTSTPKSGVLDSVLDLPGETTLAEAHTEIDFDILLPTYPPELGDPDHVFMLRASTTSVALIWTDPNDVSTPILSLFAFPPESNVWKNGMASANELTINGHAALWTEDPHLINFEFDGQEIQRIVSDPVLIWFADGITYRLEGMFSLEEAVQIVESLELP